MHLLDLPTELLALSLSHCRPTALAHSGEACTALSSLVKSAALQAAERAGLPLPPPAFAGEPYPLRLRFVLKLASRPRSTVAVGGFGSVCVNEGGGLVCLPPMTVPLTRSLEVLEIAAGKSHCLILSRDGVRSWGDDTHGQLGHGGSEPQPAPSPRRIVSLDALGGVSAVACGSEHSLVLGTAGELLSFGRGSLGRLGLGGTDDERSPRRITTCADSRSPSRASLPRITQASCGLFHSLAVGEEGGLYSWGSGTNGRLGHGDTCMQLRPRRCSTLSDVRHASAGSGHSLAVTAAGEVYSWGQGYNGRLGHGNQANQAQPEAIDALRHVEVAQAVAGSEFSIALSAAGELYSFGAADCSGVDDAALWGAEVSPWRCALLPLRPPALAGTRIASVAAGSEHTVARAASGELWSFGAEQRLPAKMD